MKQPEIGELFVGAYLRIIEKCPLIQYNVFDVTSSSQGEIDVLGLDFAGKRLYVCEVVTHLDGAQYSRRIGGKVVDDTVDRLGDKFEHDRQFVAKVFPELDEPRFMLWSPYVSMGAKTIALEALASSWPGPGRLDLRINSHYSDAMTELLDASSRETKQRGELFYRMLQLLTHLRGQNNKRLCLRLSNQP